MGYGPLRKAVVGDIERQAHAHRGRPGATSFFAVGLDSTPKARCSRVSSGAQVEPNVSDRTIVARHRPLLDAGLSVARPARGGDDGQSVVHPRFSGRHVAGAVRAAHTIVAF